MLKILNFRALAKDALNRDGKKIRPNTVFRSGVLSYASKSDIRNLKSYGIRDIYDFRNLEEISHMPALSDMHFKTHHFDILEKVANADAKVYMEMTRQEMHEGVIKLYSEYFVNADKYGGAVSDIIRQKNPELLFHCSAGKDRTGIFGAILMMILDFDIHAIRKEYLLLDKRSIHILGRQMLKKAGVRKKDIDIERFEPVMLVFPEFFDAYFETVLSKHKTIDEYLEAKVGVTPQIKSFFKERYLV